MSDIAAFVQARRMLCEVGKLAREAKLLLEQNQFNDAFPSRDLMDQVIGLVDDGLGCFGDSIHDLDIALDYIEAFEARREPGPERLLMREVL